MNINTIIASVLLTLGCFLIIVAALGILRFPDFYSRIHPAGKIDTLGQTIVLLSLIFYEGISMISLKLLIIIAFIYIANPTATFFIAKAAYLSGIKPWQKPQPDIPQNNKKYYGDNS